MKQPEKTEIRDDGLRYVSKATGSIFGAGNSGTMSCFRCSKHVARSRLEVFKVAGTRQYRCRGGC
jgi:hypothetical protein